MPSTSSAAARPVYSPGLSTTGGVAVLVGVVVGIGIFGFPSLVANHVATDWEYMGLWVAGGVIMLAGALCYAELGATWPDEGGEYHFLARAYGRRLALLFAWARGTVIQTGAIAVVAFIYGEYAQQLLSLGPFGPVIHAALAVLAVTALNLTGNAPTQRMQIALTVATIAALAAIVIAGMVIGHASAQTTSLGPAATEFIPPSGALGLAMVFVLLTYGGWNETAYLSGELRDVQRNMARVLVIGTLIVVTTYLLVNLAYLSVFGIDGLRGLPAAGAALMEVVAGPSAAFLLSLLVCCTALSTLNATVLTGARIYCALGRDLPRLAFLARQLHGNGIPARALLFQLAITLALLAFATLAGGENTSSVETMVAYTAPVFWFFMMLVSMAVIVLRQREPLRPRPFRVPFYPWTPLLFAASCAFLVHASARYAGMGAWLGLVILLLGLPVLWLLRRPSILA